MSSKVKINGQEHPNLAKGCYAEGLNYDYARQLKRKYGNKYKMRVVKVYEIEIEEKK